MNQKKINAEQAKAVRTARPWKHKLVFSFPEVGYWIQRARILNESPNAVTVLCLSEHGGDVADASSQTIIAKADIMERLLVEQMQALFPGKSVRVLSKRRGENGEPRLLILTPPIIQRLRSA
jgi:hypothetical protein